MKNILRFIGAPIVALLISGLLVWALSKLFAITVTFSWIGVVIYFLVGFGLFEFLLSLLETPLSILNLFMINGKRYIAVLPVIIYVSAWGYIVYVCTYGMYAICEENGIDYGVKDVVIALINVGLASRPFFTQIASSLYRNGDI